jgi:hypothetical protein
MATLVPDPILRVLPYVRARAPPGDGAKALAALDDFGWNESWMMFIGPQKGLHLDRAVDALCEGAHILELG